MKRKYKAMLGAGLITTSFAPMVNVALATEPFVNPYKIKTIKALVGQKDVDVKKGLEDSLNYKSVKWIQTPDTSEAMYKKTVEYEAEAVDNNGSVKFKIPVIVLKSYTEDIGENKGGYNPHVEQKDVKKIVRLVERGPITNDEVKLNILNLPATKNVEIISMPDLHSPGIKTMKVRLTFDNDKTQDIDMQVECVTKDELEKAAIKNQLDSMKKAEDEYNKTLSKNDRRIRERIGESNIVTEVKKQGEVVDISDNIYGLPKDAKVKVINSPNSDKIGKFEGLVEVTFADGEKLSVKIPVEIIDKNSPLDTQKKGKSFLEKEAEKNNTKNHKLNENDAKAALKTLDNDPSNINKNSPMKGEAIKGEALKGEKVKTGEVAKKGIIAGLGLVAAALGVTAFYIKKKRG